MKPEEVKGLLNALDDLLDIKILIRKITPDYKLDKLLKDDFIMILRSLKKKLNPIFKSYLGGEFLHDEIKDKIIEIMDVKNIALISSKSSKKKLKNIGIDLRNVIVTGGPLFFEDYKLLNPNLSEKSLSSVKKRSDSLINELKSQDWSQKELIFIYEEKNPTDQLILDKLEAIKTIIGKEIKILPLNSWNQLDSEL